MLPGFFFAQITFDACSPVERVYSESDYAYKYCTHHRTHVIPMRDGTAGTEQYKTG